MPKLAPAHRRLLNKISDPKRRDRQFIVTELADAPWQMVGALRDMGFLVRHPRDLQGGQWIPTALAAAEMDFKLPDIFIELWQEIMARKGA